MIKYHIIATRLYRKLTSSMPLMNPFGSFSISMFGFLFILDGRRTTDQNVQAIHTPALLPLLPARSLQAQQPGRFCAMTSLVILGSLAGHGQTFAGITGGQILLWLESLRFHWRFWCQMLKCELFSSLRVSSFEKFIDQEAICDRKSL